ncbi:MAG: cation-transporting P-type ATPase [Streptosporangiaceae bacterium]
MTADAPATVADRDGPDLAARQATAGSISARSPAEVFGALASSSRGLAAAEAASRLAALGPNELRAAKRPPVIKKVLAQFTNLFALVLLGASVITFVSYLIQSPRDTGSLELAVAILAVVLLNGAIGFFQEYSAEKTSEALQALVPHTARVRRDGALADIPARGVVRGDVFVLQAGDDICCDGRLVEAHGLTVDDVALTGESAPVHRTAEAVPAGTVTMDAANLVFMGTSVVEGTATAVAFATGTDTQFGQIYQMTAQVTEVASPLQRNVNRMARQVSAVAVALAALVFGLRTATTSAGLVDSFVFALGVMVALVPEGLPATLSVSLAIAVRRMASRHALIKRLAAVETLGSTTVICTDKTGTLTKAEMTVTALWESGRRHPVSGAGYKPEGVVSEPDQVTELLQVAAQCCDARLLEPDPARHRDWRILGDTTEGAIIVAAAKAGVDTAAANTAAPRIGEFPFDSERKLMTTLHRTPAGYTSYVKGSPQELVGRCDTISWAGTDVPLTEDYRRQVTAVNDQLAGEALRVLAVARRHLDTDHPDQDLAEHGLTLLGLVAMMDPPRSDVIDAVAACRKAGIRIAMVTGDYGVTAEAIARRVGIITGPDPGIISGQQLEVMSVTQLADELASHSEMVFARVRPEHKQRIVAAFQHLGQIVAATGDGVNDAPALKQADIGVAMGVTGTDVAREAAVMVLLDDSFASIVASVELGRSVYANIRKFIIYIFSHNISEIAPILLAAAIAFPLVPLSALQVLSIDLGSDILPALALGAEPPDAGVMNRPPRPVTERLLSGPVVRRFLFLGAIQAAGVCFAFFWRIHSAHLGFGHFTAANPVYREARTMTQAGIIVSQFFNSLTVRSEDQSILTIGVFTNRRLLLAGAFGIALVSCISYIPALQGVFGTAGLTVWDWLMLTGFGLALLLADEGRKAVVRHRRPQ